MYEISTFLEASWNWLITNWENLVLLTVGIVIVCIVYFSLSRKINNLKERIKALTNVGSIKAINVIEEVQLTTKVGDIELVAHNDLSAKIQASTKVGSIKSELPLEIKKEDFVSSTAKGTIGSGEKSIRLTTEVGKINIRKKSRESSDNSFEQSISIKKNHSK